MKLRKPSERLEECIGGQLFSRRGTERLAVEVVQDGLVMRFVKSAKGGWIVLGAANQFRFFIWRQYGR